jgi:hypothetical protein
MNLKQRQGAYVALAMLVILLFLHCPWTGYETTWYFELTRSHHDLPPWEWHTNAPLLPWLGSLQNLVASITFIALLAVIWIVANRQATAETPRH